MLRPTVLALTVLSGFTGLAYEVTWQKYLAILLGAHSEATSAVLGLFLGGLSLGSRCSLRCSRAISPTPPAYTRRSTRAIRPAHSPARSPRASR